MSQFGCLASQAFRKLQPITICPLNITTSQVRTTQPRERIINDYLKALSCSLLCSYGYLDYYPKSKKYLLYVPLKVDIKKILIATSLIHLQIFVYSEVTGQIYVLHNNDMKPSFLQNLLFLSSGCFWNLLTRFGFVALLTFIVQKKFKPWKIPKR